MRSGVRWWSTRRRAQGVRAELETGTATSDVIDVDAAGSLSVERKTMKSVYELLVALLCLCLGGWCQTRGARLDVPASPLAVSSIPPLRTGSDEISSLRVARRIADPHTDV